MSINNISPHVELEHAPQVSNQASTESTGASGVFNSIRAKSGKTIRAYALGELETFTDYLKTLDFGPGQRDYSGHKAFLRAGGLGIRPEEAIAQVAEAIIGTGGTFDPAKLKSQLRRAYEFVGTQAGETKALVKPPRAVFNPEKLRQCASKVAAINADWLREQSPIPVPTVTSAEFLEHLYQVGERVVVFTTFRSQGQRVYEVGSQNEDALPAGGPDGVWFLVNPVDGQYYPNPRQEGKPSRRSEESITSWRYLVLESDVADPNAWLSCLVQFPLRIVAVYTSGGRSIHALVRLDATSKQDWDTKRSVIAPIVVALGADEHALTAVRLSRLPGTMRGERQQELLYLNPKADGTAIIGRGN